MGRVREPANGRRRTRAFLRAKGSEPLVFGLLRRVGVVLGGLALELEGDVAGLLTIGGNRFDRIELMPIAEGNLNAEGAIG